MDLDEVIICIIGTNWNFTRIYPIDSDVYTSKIDITCALCL